MTISIVIPTYNEKDNILLLINAIKRVMRKLRKFKYEIVVVDDNSPDKTGLIVNKRFSKNKNIKAYIRTKEKGFASAIKHGIEKSKGDYVVVMDSDFSHSPELIPTMITRIKNADIVLGSRYARNGGGENKQRFWLSKIYNIYLRYFLGVRITDFLFGYFCTKRSYLVKNNLVNDKIFNGFGDYFIRLAAYINKAGGTFIEIPAYYKNRIHGESKSNLLKMLITYTVTSFDVLHLRFEKGTLKKNSVRQIPWVKLIAFFLFVIYFYSIITNFFGAFVPVPATGDSFYYHIPVAKNVLNGNIFFQKNIIEIEQWWPGASHIILALFMLFHFPVNLFNVIGTIVFSIALYVLGKEFLKDKTMSLIFSLTISYSYAMFRLPFTQTIDIWLAAYFMVLVVLFENPKKDNKYFLITGFLSGMLVGSKYTGPIFLLALLMVYFKKLVKCINVQRLILFLVPFTLFGISWYIRNLILTGDPFYPQSVLFFKGPWDSATGYLSIQTWNAILNDPIKLLNALISEFNSWPILFLIIPVFVVYRKAVKISYPMWPKFKRVLWVFALCLLFSLIFPSDKVYIGIVASMRHVFVLHALGVLLVFLVAKYFKKEKAVALISLTNIFVISLHPYHPKLSLILTSLIIFIAALPHCFKKIKFAPVGFIK
jgi:dolichol-phosphate mannosyltransferase